MTGSQVGRRARRPRRAGRRRRWRAGAHGVEAAPARAGARRCWRRDAQTVGLRGERAARWPRRSARSALPCPGARRRVGAREVRHQPCDADLGVVGEGLRERRQLAHRDAEARHAGVDLQVHVARGSALSRNARGARRPRPAATSWTTGDEAARGRSRRASSRSARPSRGWAPTMPASRSSMASSRSATQNPSTRARSSVRATAGAPCPYASALSTAHTRARRRAAGRRAGCGGVPRG